MEDVEDLNIKLVSDRAKTREVLLPVEQVLRYRAMETRVGI